MGRCSCGKSPIKPPNFYQKRQNIDDRRVAGCGVYYTQKSRSTQRLWSGDEQIKSQRYRIARTAARQSHGMEPNFVPDNYTLL